MTRSTSLRRLAAATAALGLALAAFMAVSTMGSTAQASPPSAGQPQTDPAVLLFLSVTPRNGPITTAILFCGPPSGPGGLHPNPAAACVDLFTAGGDFTKLPGIRESIICPDVYDPVVASAFGWYGGRLIVFTRSYPNMCELYGATGPVFPVPQNQPRPPTPTRPTSTLPNPTVTYTVPPWPTRTTGTGPAPTVPGPTVTIDPPNTTIPN